MYVFSKENTYPEERKNQTDTGIVGRSETFPLLRLDINHRKTYLVDSSTFGV